MAVWRRVSRGHGLAICLLIRGADDDAVKIKGPEGVENDFLWKASSINVNTEGAMISNEIHVSKTAAYCVALWLPPAEYRGPLTILECESGQRHAYELKSENITHVSQESGASPEK